MTLHARIVFPVVLLFSSRHQVWERGFSYADGKGVIARLAIFSLYRSPVVVGALHARSAKHLDWPLFLTTISLVETTAAAG